MSTASKLKQRIEREQWQPTTIESADYMLELNEVHAMTEVGFVLWRKRDDGQLDLVTSGHTMQEEIVGSGEEPLQLTGATDDTIVELLDG